MKAEEKAKEIYDNFDMYPLTYASKKALSIWHVDQIIESTFSKKKSWDNWKITPADYCTTEFWQEVKQHLLTLNQ